MTLRIVVRAPVICLRTWASVIAGRCRWFVVWLPSAPIADIRRADIGSLSTKSPVRKKLPATLSLPSVARIESTPSPLAPASKVSATTLWVVGMRPTTRPTRDGAIVAVRAVVLVRIVGFDEVVLVVAVVVADDVRPEEEEGAVLVSDADVVEPSCGVCDEGPHAAPISRNPMAKPATLVPRPDIRTLAHLPSPNQLSPRG